MANIISSLLPPNDPNQLWADLSSSPVYVKRFNPNKNVWERMIDDYPDEVIVKNTNINLDDELTYIKNQISGGVNLDNYYNKLQIDDKFNNVKVGAMDVEYTNSKYPTIPTVAIAIDKILENPSEILYFKNNINIAERGQIIQYVNFEWKTNKSINGQEIIGLPRITPSVRNYEASDQGLTNDKTYTLIITDSISTDSATTEIKFLLKDYFGLSDKTSLTNQDILALNSDFITSTTTKNFNFNGGKYFYFCCSKDKKVSFKYEDINIPMIKTELTFTNTLNYSEPIYIYRSLNKLNNTDMNININIS